MSTPRSTCPRCDGTPLAVTDSADVLTFWSCPTCHRVYALDGDALTERRLGSLSVALYGVIFDRHPQPRAAGPSRASPTSTSTGSPTRSNSNWPGQPVHRILPGMQATEAALREYLGLVAAHI